MIMSAHDRLLLPVSSFTLSFIKKSIKSKFAESKKPLAYDDNTAQNEIP